MELEGSFLPHNILPHQPQHLPLNRQFGICPTIPSSLVLFPQALLLYFLKARCCICFAGCFVPLQQSAFLFNLFLIFSRYEQSACFSILVEKIRQIANTKADFAGLFPTNGFPMNPSIQTLVADGGLKSELTGPLFISDNSKKK